MKWKLGDCILIPWYEHLDPDVPEALPLSGLLRHMVSSWDISYLQKKKKPSKLIRRHKHVTSSLLCQLSDKGDNTCGYLNCTQTTHKVRCFWFLSFPFLVLKSSPSENHGTSVSTQPTSHPSLGHRDYTQGHKQCLRSCNLRERTITTTVTQVLEYVAPQVCKALAAKLNLTSLLRLSEHHGSFSDRMSPNTGGHCLSWVRVAYYTQPG